MLQGAAQPLACPAEGVPVAGRVAPAGTSRSEHAVLSLRHARCAATARTLALLPLRACDLPTDAWSLLACIHLDEVGSAVQAVLLALHFPSGLKSLSK